MSRDAVTIRLNEFPPDSVLPVDEEFADDYALDVQDGCEIAAESSVVFVGMARQIADVLPVTIHRLEEIGSRFRQWNAVVVENDSTDGTKGVLESWRDARAGGVIVDCRDLGREHLHGFERLRVERYAEYRNRYREIAANAFPRADYVIAVDLDPWGGFSLDGVMHSLAMFGELPEAACMASTSLYRARTDAGKLTWAHYDLWALRMYGPRPRFDPWQPLWLPPPGAKPIRVVSAFGALATYIARPFYEAQYRSIDGDIEHVGLHLSLADSGWQCYLNPASRVVMHWLQGLTPDD